MDNRNYGFVKVYISVGIMKGCNQSLPKLGLGIFSIKWKVR